MSKQRIYLVTGSAGFIGKALINKLISEEENCIIYAYDIKYAVSPLPPVPHPNIKILKSESEIEDIICSVDYIYHLASSVGVSKIENEPLESITNSLDISRFLIELSNIYDIPVLFTSTSEVYGNSKEIPYKETQDLQILSTRRGSYASVKLTQEYWFKFANPKSVIVRLFNIAGCGQLPESGMVIPSMINKAMNNEKIIVHGDGSQVRCFCEVNEACHMMYKLANTPTACGGVFNIGNPNNEISMIELAIKINKICGKNINNIEFIGYNNLYTDSVDIMHRVPSIEKVVDYISYSPVKDMEDIITDTYKRLKLQQ